MPMGNPQASSLYLTMECTSANIKVTNGPTTLIQKHICTTGKSFKEKKQKNKNKNKNVCGNRTQIGQLCNRVIQPKCSNLIIQVLKMAYDTQSAQVTQRFMWIK